MGRWLRRAGIALLCSLLAGFAIGTCVRLRAERPTVYIGAVGRLSQGPLGSPAARRAGARGFAAGWGACVDRGSPEGISREVRGFDASWPA